MGKLDDVPNGPATAAELDHERQQRIYRAVNAIVELADEHKAELDPLDGLAIAEAARGIVLGLCMTSRRSSTAAHILGAAMLIAAAPQPNPRLALASSIAYLEKLRDDLYPIDPGTLS